MQTHTHLANDIGDGVSSFDAPPLLGVDPQGNVDMRKTLLIWVVLGVLGQGLACVCVLGAGA